MALKDNNDRKCIICGSYHEVRNVEGKQYLCGKHRAQLRTYGKILKRTRYDKNEIVIKDNYAEMLLYNKEHAECNRVLIDIDDIELVKDITWALHNSGYACNRKMVNGKLITIFLHRLIMQCDDSDIEIDHISRNRLDCRKINLRKATRRQNSCNRSITNQNTSGFIGVCYVKANGKYQWLSQIKINFKNKFLGYSDNIKDAVIKRIKGEIEHFGEFRNKHNELKYKEVFGEEFVYE